MKLLLTEISVHTGNISIHTGNICADIHCVRSMRLECENKYLPRMDLKLG